MQVSHLEHRDFSVAASARALADALQPHLLTPVTAPDAVALTGLSLEQARDALAYLALRNAAQVTFLGDEVAYIFTRATATIRGTLPSTARSFGRYLTDLLASQAAYLLGALATVGPAFIGVTMVDAGMASGNLFELLGGGTLALAATATFLRFVVRSITVILPPLVVAGIVIGWEQWSANDLYWLPVVVAVAVAMQMDTLLSFRNVRPKDSLHLLFWGHGFVEPLRESKRVTDLISNLGGTVTIGDLMRHFGWTAEQAGERLADILMEYGGDIGVDRHGKMYLRFEELAGSRMEAAAPAPAYELERKPPGPFYGLNPGWVFVVAVICWIGLVASPLNPAYTAFVAEFDVTLAGWGKFARSALAALFGLPLLVYVGRLFLNLLERPEFAERRKFLDALEYADRHAAGSHIAPAKISTPHLVDLGAQIDEERSIPGAVWVSFPELQNERGAASANTIFDLFESKDHEDVTDRFTAGVAREVSASSGRQR